MSLTGYAGAQSARCSQAQAHDSGQVAEAVGISTNIYGRYENGGRWPSIETFRAICAVLDVSADTLLGIEPGQMPSAPALSSDDPPMVRRLLDKLRQASRGTRRFVAMLLAEVETRRRGQP